MRIISDKKGNQTRPYETVETLQRRMPKLRHRGRRVPCFLQGERREEYKPEPVWYTVIATYPEHLQYLVQYHGSGLKEMISVKGEDWG